MNIQKLFAESKEYSQELTEFARKLAFVAAAICWFFKKEPEVTFPTAIYFSLFFIVLFFFFDVLQYLVGTVTLYAWTRKKEKEYLDKYKEKAYEQALLKPIWIIKLVYSFFLLKIFFLCLAFLALGQEFISRMIK